MQKIVNYIVILSPVIVSSLFVYKSQYPAWANSLFLALIVSAVAMFGLFYELKKRSEVSVLVYGGVAAGLLAAFGYAIFGPDNGLVNYFGKGLSEWSSLSIVSLFIMLAYVLSQSKKSKAMMIVSLFVTLYTVMNYFLIINGVKFGVYTGYLNVPMVAYGKLFNYSFVFTLVVLLASLFAYFTEKRGILFAGLSNKKFYTFYMYIVAALVLVSGLAYYSLRFIAADKYIKTSTLFNSGDLAGARSSLNSAITLAPFDVYYLARIEITNVDIQNILNSTSTDKEALQKSYVEAVNSQVSDALSATSYDPKNPRNYMALGLAYERSMLVDKDRGYALAVEAYEKARALAEDKDYVDVVKAKLAFSAEKEEEALASIDRALSYNASSAPALYISSQYYAAKNNIKPAIDYAEKTVKVAPLAEDARMQLGLLQFKNNELDKALEMFVAAYKLSENRNNLALYYIASTYKLKGDIENLAPAIAELESRVGNIKEVQELKAGADLDSKSNQTSATSTPVTSN